MTPIHVVEIAPPQCMRGWWRNGEFSSILLNHDVPIDPGAQAIYGYSRAYLRQHGVCPYEAHTAFRVHAGDLPMVACNLSFDGNRVLEPEHGRLGVPVAHPRLGSRFAIEPRKCGLHNLSLFRQDGARGWPFGGR